MDVILLNVADASAAVFQIHTVALIAVGVLCGIVAGAIPGFTIAMAARPT